MKNENKRFVVQKTEGNPFSEQFKIFVDKETGVNYLYVCNGSGGAGLTPLLDVEGKPLISSISID